MSKASMRFPLAVAAVWAAPVLLAALWTGCSQETPPPATAAVAPCCAQPAAAVVKVDDEMKPAVAQPAVVAAKADGENMKLESCDGENTVTVAATATGQDLADSLMDQWKRSHPEAHWVSEEVSTHGLKPPADNAGLLQGPQAKGDAYGNFTARDLFVWNRETEKFVAEGSRIFHDAGRLGSTVAVSCDMCHPNAANTHPETYPKFQTQLGRVALLRDMINWCVEHPVRGQKLDPDGPAMRALEAYILAQRKGTAMDYGKH